MKKKTNIRTMIRQIVREEVAMAIHEVITELKQPKQSKPIVKESNYSKNKVLNDVLNETAMGGNEENWETLGGTTYTSDRMNEIMGNSYADMMNGNQQPNADTMVRSMGGNPDAVGDTLKNALTRDYSELVKAMDKKK